MKTTQWISISVAGVALLVVPGPALTHPSAADPPPRVRPVTSPVLAPVSERVLAPSPRLVVADPLEDPHGIADQLVDDLGHVPAGERVEVSTYWVDSARILRALARAHARGVVVQVLVADVDRARTPRAVRLARVLNRARDGSRWVWSRGSARTAGDGGLMHEKTYRMSRVGLERWVVLTGSWNSAADSAVPTSALALRVAGRPDVWGAFERVAADQLRQRPLRHPLREYGGPGWSAYFLPLGAGDPDPALRRLGSLPAAPTTVVRATMFSMWGDRARAAADQLVRVARGGGRVTLVAGPTVQQPVVDRLQVGGVRVVPGCWRDGSFAHGKDMAASFVRDGRRERWTWVGSDNWTDGGTAQDQAVLGVRDPAVHAAFVRAFDALVQRPGGLWGGDCPADLD